MLDPPKPFQVGAENKDRPRDEHGRRSEKSSDASHDDRAQKGDQAADALPAVTLPKGGGAIRGIGEKFSVNAATGTAAVSIPLPISKGRAGFVPDLSLSYDSGAGNGIFGFGWSLSAPSISRKTDKGLPRYVDDEESDVFILSGAEDLVPVLDSHGARVSFPHTVHKIDYQIHFYRPRIEGVFARIERWVATKTGITHWRSISRENVTTLYGFDAHSQIADPENPRKICSWRICRSFDDKGNLALYTYDPEDGVGIVLAKAHEANRSPAIRATQVYLKSIQYGNVAPYFPDWTADAEPGLPTQWMFSVVFDYGDHTANPPTPVKDAAWAARPDPFSSYRAGFELRTYRRVQRVLFFNKFPQEKTVGANALVRSLDLIYSDQRAPSDARNPIYTFLTSATLTGYSIRGVASISRSMPALECDYSQPQIQQSIVHLDPDSLGNLPEGIDGTRFRWTDLDGEGLSGILSETSGGWRYKRNLSANNILKQPDGISSVTRARFGPLEQVTASPSAGSLSAGLRLLDLSGGGQLDVVDLAGPDCGFFKRSMEEDFEPFRSFEYLPQLDWSDPNIKFIDVTGDGLADVFLTEDGLFTFYSSLGEAGFDVGRFVRPPWDEERGPQIVFADGSNTIFIADMSGDGLNDIVRVRNGETCYWPNIGYGKFGPKVTMDGAPRFDNEERFDPQRVRLADVDGSGSADLLYVGEDGVRVWFNQSGNAWSAPTLIAVFPTTDRLSDVQVFDLLGSGTACLVWSSPLPSEATRPLCYVDLMGGQKPHLLVSARNNLGAETRVAYAPSTRFYLDAKKHGRPWITKLPFPVQVVERVESFDWIGRNRFVTRYAYHHGFFDGYEREFRGFGMVEQWDTEEFREDVQFSDGAFTNWAKLSWSPPVCTKTWFHTGAFVEAQSVSLQYLSEYWPADAAAMRLPDSWLPSDLSPFERREAYRALKGRALRIEVYGETQRADGSMAKGNPYTVTEQNFTVECLQRTGLNAHAVFKVDPRESRSFNYERQADDPRVTHEFTLETDLFGNVVRSVSVGYPRRKNHPAPEPTLSTATQAMLDYDQARLHLRGSARDYTNAFGDLDHWPPAGDPRLDQWWDNYRAPLPAATDVAELTGITPSAKGSGVASLFAFDEVNGGWIEAWKSASDIPYEAVPACDIDGAGNLPATPTRRFIAKSRTLYRADDLSALLALKEMQPRALSGETYRAALTTGQLSAIFDALVTPEIVTEGGYVSFPGETGQWSPSGRLYYSPGDTDSFAQELKFAVVHFFQPRRSVDPFAAVTRIDYDAYDLLPVAATDAVGNVTGASNDYRVLAPNNIIDPNENRAAVAFDALGLVTATAVQGKTDAVGDQLSGFQVDLDEATLVAQFSDPLANPAALLGNATTRFVYDINAYTRTSASLQPSPAGAYTLARETHVSDLGVAGNASATKFQFHFAYSDGFGREIQRKARAAPGPLTVGGATTSPRWVCSGWTIFNNKEKPVLQYEPFFSGTNGFEFSAQFGVSTVLFYDPPGRIVATLHPDNSWEKVVFDAWRQETWDGNDTALISDLIKDADVGEYFRRYLSGALSPFVSWYILRKDGNFGATADDKLAQQDAAQKTSKHAATPTVVHFDSLGRACLSVSDNGGGARYPTRTAYDTEGKPLAVFDPLGRRTEEYCFRAPQGGGLFEYIAGVDMVGAPLYRINTDGGARRGFNNVAGNPIRSWDARGQAFQFVYDAAQRPVQRLVSVGSGAQMLIDLSIYGENMPAQNLCGRVFRHYDMAGFLENSPYDFKGNLVRSVRQLAADYHKAVDWTPLAKLIDPAQLDAAATAANLIPINDGGRDKFVSETVYDALNRPIQQITPRNATMKPNVLRTGYDEGAQLLQVDVWLQQGTAPAALLDPATADRHAASGITYNPRGQRLSIAFGNGTITTYDYDPLTFRLAHLTTTRPASFAANAVIMQALAYYYDPVGNITRIRDSADTQNVIFFQNQRVEPSTDCTYDAIYRLVVAKGREHLGQTGHTLLPPQQVTNDDGFRTGQLQPWDGNAMGTYTESYLYDASGNISAMSHSVSSGSWTRRYAYTEQSLIVGSEKGNRLSATSLPGDPDLGPYSATYGYDEHGNMMRMPHLPAMVWDEDDRLRSTTRQVVSVGAPETTFYTYDSGGQRMRKATDRQAQAGQASTRKAERIYLGSVELYREYAIDGAAISLERETLNVSVGGIPIARAETLSVGIDTAPAQQVRYQFSNYLGSSMLELDDQSKIISYEEYFPFGSTSYQAVVNQTDLPKRFRYTGKERDTENELYYHGARYYAPWLGRWTACDPEGLGDGVNLYGFVRQNPVRFSDPTGTDSAEPTPKPRLTEEQKDALKNYKTPIRGAATFWTPTGKDKKGNTTSAVTVVHPKGSHPSSPSPPVSNAPHSTGSAGGGTSSNPRPPSPPPTVVDELTKAAGILSLQGGGDKDGVSGGIPGGMGPKENASAIGQAAFIALAVYSIVNIAKAAFGLLKAFVQGAGATIAARLAGDRALREGLNELTEAEASRQAAAKALSNARSLGFGSSETYHFNAGMGPNPGFVEPPGISKPYGQFVSDYARNRGLGTTINETPAGQYAAQQAASGVRFPWADLSKDLAEHVGDTGAEAHVTLGGVNYSNSVWLSHERPALRAAGIDYTVHLFLLE